MENSTNECWEGKDDKRWVQGCAGTWIQASESLHVTGLLCWEDQGREYVTGLCCWEDQGREHELHPAHSHVHT
eukprot:838905-Pelagomonas_calceolata.AAC.2